MLRLKTKWLLLAMVVFFSCKQNSGVQPAVYIDEPSQADTLFADTTLPMKFKGTPGTVGLIDTILITVNKESPYLNFYSTTSYNYLASFGIKGEGAGTLGNPQYDNQFVHENTGTKFYILDYQRNSIGKYDLSKILNDSTTKAETVIRLHPLLVNRYSSAFSLSNGLIVGNLTNKIKKGTGRYFIYAPSTNTLTTIPLFPEVSADSLPISPYYYYSHSGISRTGSTIASAMRRFKRVDFITLSENTRTIRPAVFTKYKSLAPSGLNSINPPEGSLGFYNAVFAGNSSFYALCVDNKVENYTKNIGNMSLQEFSWDGRLKRNYLLDRMYLGTFCVDEINRRLYVINFGADRKTLPILVYHLAKRSE